MPRSERDSASPIGARLRIAWAVVGVFLVSTLSAGEERLDAEVQRRLRLETAGLPSSLEVGDERIHAATALPASRDRRLVDVMREPPPTPGDDAPPSARASR